MADRRQRAGLAQTCWADLRGMAALKGTPFPSATGLVDVLLLPGTWAVLLFRLSTALRRAHLSPLATVVRIVNLSVLGADLSPAAPVEPGLAIAHPMGVCFGHARVGARVSVMGNVRVGGMTERVDRPGDPAIVGPDCYLMDGAKVAGGVTVGRRAVVGNNAVAHRDLAPGAVAVGDPARAIRFREPEGDGIR